MNKKIRFIGCLFLFVLPGVLGCSSLPGSPTAEANPTSELSSSFQPLDAETCSELADTLASATGVDVTTDDAPFEDYVSNESGRGCQATAGGTGQDFASPSAVATDVGAAMTAQGWTEDPQYAAGGPTGMSAAYRQDDDLCILQVNWEPSPDANCPDDQPIAACELTPEQQLYTVDLNCATQSSTQ